MIVVVGCGTLMLKLELLSEVGTMRKGQLAVGVRTHGPHKHRATKDERVMLLLTLLVIFPCSVSLRRKKKRKKKFNKSSYIQFISNETSLA